MTIAVNRGPQTAPLYAQIRDAVATMIANEAYSPGDLLPSVPALSEQLEVSRATVIKAFDELEERNLIERRQGKGTFVAARPQAHSLGDLMSFTAVTRAGDQRPGQRWISFSDLPAGVDGRSGPAVDFPAEQDLVRLERVRLIDQEPVGYQVAVIPADLARRAGIADHQRDNSSFSLYESLGEIGHRPVTASQSLRAIECPPRIAEALKLPVRTAMMRVHRISRDRLNRLVESVDAYYVGSLYEYRTDMAIPTTRTHERFQ